ncbi:low affinity iron permease family protein [Bosea sp. 117]|uniref:low affinity iron permease family protein n=1 Tax=Bosea sp. 117 TaxID=1125973 RepID=UPI00068C9520|nr:low affinity iron permease family protein [Bosea sp. 117]
MTAQAHIATTADSGSKNPDRRRRSLFTRFAQHVSAYAGKPITFIAALSIIVLWAVSGPIFGFNDTWQLVINTSTTIITFLMVFVIQNSQNRDTAALQIKLDELISKLEGPREILLDLEELDDAELEKLRAEFEAMAEKARQKGG